MTAPGEELCDDAEDVKGKAGMLSFDKRSARRTLRARIPRTVKGFLEAEKFCKTRSSTVWTASASAFAVLVADMRKSGAYMGSGCCWNSMQMVPCSKRRRKRSVARTRDDFVSSPFRVCGRSKHLPLDDRRGAVLPGCGKVYSNDPPTIGEIR